jgi:hypothetical protein
MTPPPNAWPSPARPSRAMRGTHPAVRPLWLYPVLSGLHPFRGPGLSERGLCLCRRDLPALHPRQYQCPGRRRQQSGCHDRHSRLWECTLGGSVHPPCRGARRSQEPRGTGPSPYTRSLLRGAHLARSRRPPCPGQGLVHGPKCRTSLSRGPHPLSARGLCPGTHAPACPTR